MRGLTCGENPEVRELGMQFMMTHLWRGVGSEGFVVAICTSLDSSRFPTSVSKNPVRRAGAPGGAKDPGVTGGDGMLVHQSKL